MESRGHCLLSKAQMSLQISVRVAEIKLISFGGGAGQVEKETDQGNEMVKIWCGWRERMYRSGDYGCEFEGSVLIPGIFWGKSTPSESVTPTEN